MTSTQAKWGSVAATMTGAAGAVASSVSGPGWLTVILWGAVAVGVLASIVLTLKERDVVPTSTAPGLHGESHNTPAVASQGTAAPSGSDSFAQQGEESAQAVAKRDAIVQTGRGPKLAQQGQGNSIHYYEVAQAHRADDGRVYCDLTPDELSAPYDDMPSDDADNLMQKYIGTWLLVEGPLHDRTRGLTGFLMVSFASGTHGRTRVGAFFQADAEKARVALIKRGGHIKVVGKIIDIGSRRVALDECALLKH